ncbi:MAG: hypothetical protein KJ574_01895 [Nanoarchaeota archaeon]|nr:hypothetical protein [Nanoarchaeota archaeon]
MVKKDKWNEYHYPKQIKPTTEGRCPYCHKDVKSLEDHIHDKHRTEKLPKKK